MRFMVEVQLRDALINKDKNRAILSLFKHCLSKYDEPYFKEIYESGEASPKNYTFSLYMPKCKFFEDTIEIPDKKIYINVSTYDLKLGIQFYNAFMSALNSSYLYKGNEFKITKVKLSPEQVVDSEKVVFKTLSACVAREHFDDNSRTYYHSLDSEKGREVFVSNLKVQAGLQFPDKEDDIRQLEMRILSNKEVKIKYYDIVVLSNLCTFEMSAKPYLLDYFYKAGASSLKSAGFGMLDIV